MWVRSPDQSGADACLDLVAEDRHGHLWGGPKLPSAAHAHQICQTEEPDPIGEKIVSPDTRQPSRLCSASSEAPQLRREQTGISKLSDSELHPPQISSITASVISSNSAVLLEHIQYIGRRGRCAFLRLRASFRHLLDRIMTKPRPPYTDQTSSNKRSIDRRGRRDRRTDFLPSTSDIMQTPSFGSRQSFLLPLFLFQRCRLCCPCFAVCRSGTAASRATAGRAGQVSEHGEAWNGAERASPSSPRVCGDPFHGCPRSFVHEVPPHHQLVSELNSPQAAGVPARAPPRGCRRSKQQPGPRSARQNSRSSTSSHQDGAPVARAPSTGFAGGQRCPSEPTRDRLVARAASDEGLRARTRRCRAKLTEGARRRSRRGSGADPARSGRSRDRVSRIRRSGSATHSSDSPCKAPATEASPRSSSSSPHSHGGFSSPAGLLRAHPLGCHCAPLPAEQLNSPVCKSGAVFAAGHTRCARRRTVIVDKARRPISGAERCGVRAFTASPAGQGDLPGRESLGAHAW